MARRTKQDAEETRKHILDAAEQCFRDTGIYRTTLQMIAMKAGCTRGAIYWHFREKNDLFKQVIERTPLLLFTEIEGVLKRSESVMALRHCLLREIECVKRNNHLRNIIEMTIFRRGNPDEVNDHDVHMEDKMNKVFVVIDSVFSEAQKKGMIHADISTKMLSSMIFFVFMGALRSIVMTPGDTLIHRYSQSALDFAFDMVIGNKAVCNEK
ncbi:TetR family transcriptional regulator [Enterobacter bugandensis]|uniref:TetR family transcriptional regulator n=1 Tax=Enterobacter TaxID=547 RepID=UPI000F8484DC|nr:MULTISPECIES: TetR family transcriptional regulator [Enterobacter]EGS2004342.1 TetR family transcriptional regulator [Enterobacter cloacae]MBT2090645.1 TetR family transcriptional regulator [Enterobacter bugandensis]RTQ02433.1 TetR family transcriptional regulator [Enterobacter sp. WCHEn045836]